LREVPPEINTLHSPSFICRCDLEWCFSNPTMSFLVHNYVSLSIFCFYCNSINFGRRKKLHFHVTQSPPYFFYGFSFYFYHFLIEENLLSFVYIKHIFFYIGNANFVIVAQSIRASLCTYWWPVLVYGWTYWWYTV
jgi:hypothetical protein